MGTRSMITICRLCLRDSQYLSNIFEVNVNRTFVLADVITDLLQYPVLPNDGYPQSICSNCSDKLTEFTLFKEQCRESKAAYDNFFAMRSHCEVQHDIPQSPVTYIKSEPLDLADEEEVEVQPDTNATLAVKQEDVEVDIEEGRSPSGWACNDDSSFETCDIATDQEMAKDVGEAEGSTYIPTHSFETRIIHVQSLAQGSYANINYRYPMEIWQPISETAEERKRRLARERSRKLRANLTPEQLEQRREQNTKRTALRRQKESPEERARRRRLDAYRTAMRRLNETPAQKEERRRADKLRHAWRRRNYYKEDS